MEEGSGQAAWSGRESKRKARERRQKIRTERGVEERTAHSS